MLLSKHADEKAARNALKGTPEERAMVVGNTAVGVMTTVTAINFAMQGRITGGGPSFKAKDKAKLWNVTRLVTHLINLGSAENPQWIELKKLDPHGFLFGVVGDIYEMQQYMGNTNDPELTKLTAMVMRHFKTSCLRLI